MLKVRVFERAARFECSLFVLVYRNEISVARKFLIF